MFETVPPASQVAYDALGIAGTVSCSRVCRQTAGGRSRFFGDIWAREILDQNPRKILVLNADKLVRSVKMELSAEKTRSFSPHVLLAEDDDLTLRVVEQLLKQCKYKGALQYLKQSVLRAEVWDSV